MANTTDSTKRARIGVIFLTVFIDLIGFGIVIPILPLYSQHFGANETINGFLVGSYSAMQFIFSPILGRISDRVGRRPVLLVSLLGTSLGFLLMGLAPSLSYGLAWLFVARILDGISGGNISTAQAYIADITTPEERSRAMGLIGAAFGLGFIFGPAIGGLLSGISISAPFYFAAALALVNAAMVFVRLPESLAKEHRADPDDRASFTEILRHGGGLPILMIAYFLAITGFSILTTNFALFSNHRFGYDQTHNGYLFAFIGVIGALVQGGLLRPLLKRCSEKSLAIVGMIFLTVGMVLLPGSQSLSSLLVIMTVIGIGNSFVTPTLNGLASRSAEKNWQGRVIGLMQSAGSLGRWVGPILAGKLLSMDSGKAFYGRTPFWSGAVILCVGLVFTFLLSGAPAVSGESKAAS